MGCSKTMTVENIKALLDACYQAKRARELLPVLGALILQAAYGAVDLHASIFSPDAEVVQKGFEYLKGRIIYVKTASEVDEIKRLKAELRKAKEMLADEIISHKIDEVTLRLACEELKTTPEILKKNAAERSLT